MTRQSNPLQRPIALSLSTGLYLGIWTGDAIAHQVQTSADVGGTLHVEPNDTPRAGEPTLAWFALTQRGGQTVPLSDCNCQLAVYSTSNLSNNGAIATPALTPLSVEGYENIPSATVTFPEVGAYELVMTGTPAVNGAFQPFELRFEVTVATAAPAVSEPTPSPDLTSEPSEVAASPSESIPDSEGGLPVSGIAIALISLVILGLGWTVFKARRNKHPNS